MPEPKSSTKAAFTIAGGIRERIVRGELRAGDPLPVESALIQQLGSSKSVVREALRILETEGLVEVRRGLGGGPRVTHPSVLSIAQTVGVHLQLQAVSVADVWRAHAELVISGIGLLAESPEEERIAPVAAAVDDLESRIGSRATYAAAVADVARLFVRAGGNATLLLLINALHEIITSELTTADAKVGYAETTFQANVVKTLRAVLRHVRAGRVQAAQREYRELGDEIMLGMASVLPDATVVDVFPWRVP